MSRIKVWMLMGVALGFLVGCNGSDDDDDNGAGSTTFRETFSGAFPGTSWVVDEGDSAVVVANEGREGPGLVFSPSADEVNVSTAFTFTTVNALDLSLDLATPAQLEPEPSLFRVLIVGEGAATEFASANVIPAENSIELRILGDTETVVLPASGDFHRIGFAVDAFGVATWFVNGVPAMTRGSFPEGTYHLELSATGETATGFVVDNVVVTR